jgi:serine/threonine-protein kinase Chk2
MEDLIASLYARDRNDNEAESALELPENKPRFVPATPQVTDPIGRHSRESTASLDGGDGEKDPNVKRSTASRLQLTFALGPKTGPGFLFGTDPKVCDVVLPKLPNISRRHCYVTFDAARRLILRDCSKHGTVVRYGKTEGEQKKRRHFTWILGGPDLPSEISSVVIELDEQMVFQVVVAEPSFPRVFANNVDRFMQSMNTALTLDGLGIQSAASTAAASGVHTPSEDSILFVRRELGAGGFATVDLVWDVSTGIQYASKTIRDPRVCDWEREVRLMKKIRHVRRTQRRYDCYLWTDMSAGACGSTPFRNRSAETSADSRISAAWKPI